MRAGAQKKRFRPGALAPITGVYLVNHGLRHRDRHEVVIIRGEPFPTCRTCKLNVWFEIMRPVSHITHDWDFSGPSNLVIKPKEEEFKDFRIFRRGHVELPIKLQLASVSKGEFFRARTNDLGAGGLGAIIREDLPLRYRTELVKITMERSQEPLVVTARLRYRHGVRYGFEFSGVSQAEQEIIRRIITQRRIRAMAVTS